MIVSTPSDTGLGEIQGKDPIRVLIVDDHPLARLGTRKFVEKHQNVIIIGEAADGEEALSKANHLSPDVVLMDVDMPKLDGLAATKTLRIKKPEVKVLILSAHLEPDVAVRAVRAGAYGYVSKEALAEELLQAIEAVARGRKYFCQPAALTRNVTPEAERQAADLTPREREVLLAIAEGLRNEQIAGRLGLSVRTVQNHRDSVQRKLNVHGVANLTRFAMQAGLISS